MMPTETVNICFHVSATAPIGREEFIGKLRFLPDHVELAWRMKGNVFSFSGGKGEMNVTDLPYGKIEHIELIKK